MNTLAFGTIAEVDPRIQMLCEKALGYLKGDDVLAASDCCREALYLKPDCQKAHTILAEIALTGEHYYDLLQRIHRQLEPRTYLETGVADGNSIAMAGKKTLAIGIDPNPVIKRPLRSSVQVFRESSDEFFSRQEAREKFRRNPIDLAFIDGMHLFEHTLRDFINIERFSAPDATILVHDCYPLDAATSTRERTTHFWSGDVWKIVLCLKKYRPGLRIHTLAAPPTGLCLIRGLDRKSTVLPEQLEALCREFIPLPYSALEPDKASALNLVPGNWKTVRRLLT